MLRFFAWPVLLYFFLKFVRLRFVQVILGCFVVLPKGQSSF